MDMIYTIHAKLKLQYSPHRTISKQTTQKAKKYTIPLDKNGNQSVPPSFVAGIATHEPRHWLVRGPDLLHVFTEGPILVAIATLLAGVFVDGLLHRIVEAGLALLQLS